MVKVTDKDYYIHHLLKNKLDLMCARSSGKRKQDNLIIIDGDEGLGKTTLSVNIAYYVAYTLNRKFSVDNLYFDPEKMIEEAKKTKDQIYIWDEAALGGLSTEWYNKAQMYLTRFMMVARKKRHFFIFNIPKFKRLAEYLAVDRSIALIHVYAKKNLDLGYFTYYRKKNKERLYEDLKQKKNWTYRTRFDFAGDFGDNIDKLIDNEKYEEKKDKAIMNISINARSKSDIKYKLLQYRVSKLPEKFDITKENLSKALGYSKTSLTLWSKYDKKYPEILEKDD